MKRQGSRAINGHLLASLFLAGMLPIASLSSCVKLPRRYLHTGGQNAPRVTGRGAPLINVNTASAEELEKLPGIGSGLSARIIAYRKEYGHFRRPEHLLMVRGISTRRFHALQPFITTE